MVFEKREIGNHIFLVLQVNQEKDDIAYAMFENNDIEGCVKPILSQIDGKKELKYNISGLISFSELFKMFLEKKVILGILESYANVVIHSKQYLLKEDGFLLDEQTVFVEKSTGNVKMLFNTFAGAETETTENCMGFLKRVFPSFKYNTADNTNFDAIFQLFFQQNNGINPHDLIQCIKTVKEQMIEQKKSNVNREPEYVTVNANEGRSENGNPTITEKKKTGILFKTEKKEKAKKQDNEKQLRGEKTIPGKKSAPSSSLLDMSFPGGKIPKPEAFHIEQGQEQNNELYFGETVFETEKKDVIEWGPKPGIYSSETAILIRVRTGEKITLNQNVFKIGKEETQENVNYCIRNNPTISRVHVEIKKDQNRYYVIDQGSKNGTYLNNERLNPSQPYLIGNGNKIILSNEEFVFQIENIGMI